MIGSTASAELLGLPDGLPAADPQLVAAVRAAVAADDWAAADRGRLAAVGFQDFLAAVAAAVDTAIARHAALHIPDDVTRATLADVGSKVAAYGDLGIRPWIVNLLRADVITLGRLQFERAITEHGRATHIPEGGSLRPELVDDSFARARAFFADDADYSCESWMLDPAVLELPATSNLVHFRRRFDVLAEARPEPVGPDGATPGDHAVAKFVFRRPLAEVLDPAFVPRTSAQRLVRDRLRAGYHWREALGVLRRPAAG